MFKKIKEYREYKREKKQLEKNFISVASTTLSTVKEFSDKSTDIAQFFLKLIDTTKDVSGEKFVSMILHEITEKLSTDQDRLIEVLKYMANLSSDEISKILAHSVVETFDTDSMEK